MGHSRPMHLVPVPINVRCYSNSNPIVRRSEVTLGPLAEVTGSFFDDVVGEHEEFIRNAEAERLGSLEIDNEIEFGRLLDR
jgi:hypothetical protein